MAVCHSILLLFTVFRTLHDDRHDYRWPSVSSRRSRTTEGPNGTHQANSRRAVRRSGPLLLPSFRDLRGHSVEDRAPSALAVIDRKPHHWGKRKLRILGVGGLMEAIRT
jgi:hypothetical protein